MLGEFPMGNQDVRKEGQSERKDVGRHVTLCGGPHSEKRLIADFHPLIPLIRPRDISKPVNYNVG